MQLFDEFGSLIEQRWKKHSYDERLFPEIAAEALAETSLDNHLSPWEIVRQLFTATQIPSQQDLAGEFGNPPVTLYTGPRFHIDVYYWLDGTTGIHQHSFCGAFQVLLGSSLHCHYKFVPRREINEHFLVGDLLLGSVELLEQGEIKRILPGKQYIHSLFHLDRPSVSICVRTYHTVSGAPQFKYHKPYIAVDPFFKDPLTIKQIQCASLLLSMQHPEADRMIGDLVSRSDFQTAFGILDLARSHVASNHLEKNFGLSTVEERFQALLETARRRHGELVDLMLPVFEEGIRQRNLVHRRGQITSNEHRFFLALLLNVPDRAKVLELVRQRFPEQNPVSTITDWVEELANTRVAGAHEANVLGIDGIDDDYLFVLQCLLEGRTVEQTKTAFEEEFSAEEASGLGSKLEKLYSDIRNSMLFKSIFLEPTSEPASQVIAM
ncbi:MAG: hypothetical protein AABN34_08250 [Acidobacteriota bacterium]